VPRETFEPRWREAVRALQARVHEEAFAEPIAARLAAFLRSQASVIAVVVERAEQLGRALQARPPGFVLCHADLHANNVLIDAAGRLYVVDWENLIFAPRERDLMFIGGGIGGRWNRPREAELFYQGYGPTEVDEVALAYYRHERIVVDIADFCDHLLLSDASGADRERTLQKFVDAFGPNDVVAIALATDRAPRAP